jgi:hypothetical protein
MINPSSLKIGDTIWCADYKVYKLRVTHIDESKDYPCEVYKNLYYSKEEAENNFVVKDILL